MEFSIYNSAIKKLDYEGEIKLIWCSVLVSKIVYFLGQNAINVGLKKTLEEGNLDEKINVYKLIIPKLNIDRLDADEIQRFYEFKKKISKQKRKISKEIKGQLLSNSFFKQCDSIVWDYYNKNMVYYKLKELEDFFSFNNLDSVLNYGYPRRALEQTIVFDTDIYSTPVAIVNDINIMLFKENITENADEVFLGDDNFEKKIDNKKRIILSFPFYKIYPPESLENGQVKIIRKELVNKFDTITNLLSELKVEFSKLEFSYKNIKKIKEKIEKKILPEIPPLQKIIDNNIYMQMLKNMNAENKIYEMNLGITSVNNLLDAMAEQDYISLTSVPYIKEKVKTNFDTSGTIVFAFLKEKINDTK